MTEPSKKIFVLRHAESPHGGQDFQRPLTQVGLQQAEYLGRMVSARLSSLENAVWYVSAANRTQLTMQGIMKGFKENMPQVSHGDFRIEYKEELYLSESSVGQGKILCASEDVRTIVILAHNPGVSSLVNELCREYVGLRPGEGVCITLEGDWSEASTLSRFQEYLGQNHS